MKKHILLAAILSATLATGALAAEPAAPPGSAMEQARMQEILGQPPRLAPRTNLTDEERVVGGPPKEFKDIQGVPPIFAIMLHNPDLARMEIPMASQFMMDGKLDPRDRELAILRNSWLMRAPFFWGEHVGVSKKFGLTSADIEAVTRGSGDSRWNPHERAVLKAVEELHADAMISDPVWAELAKGMNGAQLVELPIMVGQYKALNLFANALRVPLRPGNPGLAGR